jgi:tellurite methyltransferase
MEQKPRDWKEYYRRTQGRPPRPTLLFALDRFAAPGFAVDLGCGEGRDTVEMLRRGWHVLAIDKEPAAIEGLRARADLPAAGRLDTMVAPFEDAQWPAADLINASFTLFFCRDGGFPALWRRIVGALKPGGRFAGQLLGPNDSWVGRPDVVIHDRAALDRLLEGLAVEMLNVEETDAVTPRGETKHWHLYHLVLRKDAASGPDADS